MTVDLRYCNECGDFLEGSLWGENLEELSAERTSLSESHGVSIEQGRRVVCNPCYETFPTEAKALFESYAIFEPIFEGAEETLVETPDVRA